MYQLADLKLGGNLERQLEEWREWGVSYREMATRLREWDVEVNASTIYRWLNQKEAS